MTTLKCNIVERREMRKNISFSEREEDGKQALVGIYLQTLSRVELGLEDIKNVFDLMTHARVFQPPVIYLSTHSFFFGLTRVPSNALLLMKSFNSTSVLN